MHNLSFSNLQYLLFKKTPIHINKIPDLKSCWSWKRKIEKSPWLIYFYDLQKTCGKVLININQLLAYILYKCSF